MKNSTLLLLFVTALHSIAYSQEEELSWEELGTQYEIPQWFTEARFGIWVHWGAQTVPDYGGGWYARHMYMQDVDCWRWRLFQNIHVNKGDKISLVAESDREEKVRLDYIEFIPKD